MMTNPLKKLTSALAVAALLSANAAFADKIKIGTEGAYPPFNYKTADGKLTGFDVEIAQALCDEMKAECEFVVQDWDGIIPALLAGKYDAIIASMSITEERKKQVDFSDKYYNTPPAIAVRRGSDLKDATPETLKGSIIGAQASTTHSQYAEEKFNKSEVRLYPTAEEYQLDLDNGRVDAVVDDIIVLTEWLKSDAGSCCQLLDSLPTDIAINGEGAGIALRKDDDDLRRRFNKAIHAILKNGKYKEINDKYFTFSVY